MGPVSKNKTKKPWEVEAEGLKSVKVKASLYRVFCIYPVLTNNHDCPSVYLLLIFFLFLLLGEEG